MKIKGFKLGATGRHPYGHAGADDEGELRMAIAADHPNAIVRVEFGKPIAWLGLPVGEARQLAALLIEKADAIEQRKQSDGEIPAGGSGKVKIKTDSQERGCWLWERCYSCGHRLRFASTGCPQCGEDFDGRKPPKTFPEQCDCERCVETRNTSTTKGAHGDTE